MDDPRPDCRGHLHKWRAICLQVPRIAILRASISQTTPSKPEYRGISPVYLRKLFSEECEIPPGFYTVSSVVGFPCFIIMAGTRNASLDRAPLGHGFGIDSAGRASNAETTRYAPPPGEKRIQ